jgi:16S rRNA processing protein RimM
MSARDSSGSARARSASGAQAGPSFGVFARKPRADRAEACGSADAAGVQPDDAAPRMETAASWPENAIEVGAIVDAYGLKGWVKVAAHAEAGRGGDALLAARRWWLMKGSERSSTPALHAKVHGDAIVAHLAGAADRDMALALRGTRVYVRREDFPSLEADEFYWVDLIGLAVVNLAGVALGSVAGMIDNGVQSVLRIEYPATGKDGKPVTGERLIPFVGVYVKTVDQAAKQIVVDWEADY